MQNTSPSLSPSLSSGRSSTQSSAETPSDSHSWNERSGLPGEALAVAAIRAAVDKKGLDVRALNISRLSDVADFFVIISGTSERHVKGLSDHIKEELAKLGEAPLAKSGYDRGEWVLLDYGDVVVHLFYEPTRQHYRFDELWQRGTAVALPEDLEQELRKLRTGIYR